MFIELFLFLPLLFAPCISISTEEEEAFSLRQISKDLDAIQEELEVLRGYIAKAKPSRSCDDFYLQGHQRNGVYQLEVDGTKHNIYCQFNHNGTGKNWMVFQRRTSGNVDFYRNWSNYSQGFGNKSDEFWMGLNSLSRMTAGGSYTLRVVLRNFHNEETYAEYSSFALLDESNNFTLQVSGYSGNAGDSLSVHNGMAFSTYDRDNDHNARLNCAVESRGGWWYNSCYESNLNGEYFNFDSRDFTGIHWFQLGKVPMANKYTEMKIRRN